MYARKKADVNKKGPAQRISVNRALSSPNGARGRGRTVSRLKIVKAFAVWAGFDPMNAKTMAFPSTGENDAVFSAFWASRAQRVVNG